MDQALNGYVVPVSWHDGMNIDYLLDLLSLYLVK